MTTEEYKVKYSHGNASASALPEPPEEIRGNDKTVFISYSTKNPEAAAFVCEWLEFNGMRCWVAPRDLLPGTNFADNIEIALGNAKMLVLVLSRQSAASPWVEGEINTAFSAGKPILVFQIDNVELTGSLKMMLSKFPTIRLGKNNSDACGAELVTLAQKSLESVKIAVHKIAGTKKLRTLQNLADEASKTSVPAGTIAAAPDEISDDDKNVFISYSTKNPEAAAFVCEWLEWAGIRCWIAPRDLISGTNFADNIEIALGNAKMLVLILSKDSANSPWVESEINVVFSAGKPILIYQIDDAEPEGSMKVMLGKFLTIRRGNVEENDGNALIESTLRLLSGEKIFVEKRAGTRKKHGKKHDSTEKFETQKCLILAAPQDMRVAQKLKNEVFRADAFAQIMDVAKLPWVREDKIPESYRRRFEESMIVVVVLSPSLEAVPAAQALIKFAFSIKKSILPYKIYVGKPSAGMSLLLGMAHWLDVSMLPNAEAGIKEFRKALKVHLARTKSFRSVYMRWFLRIAGTLILILLGILAYLLVDWQKIFAEKNVPASVEKSVPATETENGVPAENSEEEDDFDDEPVPATEADKQQAITPPMIRRNERLAKFSAEERERQSARLLKAQSENDLWSAENALAHGANPDAISAGTPLLVAAARGGNVDFVELLLCYGATPFVANENSGDDAMTAAIAESADLTHARVVELLCDYGFPVNILNRAGTTMLCEAVRKNRPRVAEILMEFGGNPNLTGTDSRMAIDEALEQKSGDFADAGTRKRIFRIKKSKSPTFGLGKIFVDQRAANAAVPATKSEQEPAADDSKTSENVDSKTGKKRAADSKNGKSVPATSKEGFVESKKFGDFEIVFISAVLSNSDGKPQKFGIGKTEVTQAQWERVMGRKRNLSKFHGNNNLPVENISRDDAMEFCEKLTARERKMKRLPKGYEYSLPTSEQWEIACRAGTTTRYCSGDSIKDLWNVAWYFDNSNGKTHPVGTKKPNDWGIFDMHGNVSEFCLGKSTRGRGGSWNSFANSCESSFAGSDDRTGSTGFRVALVPEDSAGTQTANVAGKNSSSAGTTTNYRASKEIGNSYSWKQIFPKGLLLGVGDRQKSLRNYTKLEESDFVLIFYPSGSYNFDDALEHIKFLDRFSKMFPKKKFISVVRISSFNSSDEKKFNGSNKIKHQILISEDISFKKLDSGNYLLEAKTGKVLFGIDSNILPEKIKEYFEPFKAALEEHLESAEPSSKNTKK